MCSNTVAVLKKIKCTSIISSARKLFPFNGEISWKMKAAWKMQARQLQGIQLHFFPGMPFWGGIFAFLILHHTKRATKNFTSAKSLTSEGTGQGKGWLDCTQASFWNMYPSCSDLYFTRHSFLSRSAWLSCSLQLLCCYEVQRYIEVLRSLLEDALVIRIKGG